MNDHLPEPTGAAGPLAAVVQALTWSLAGAGLMLLQVLTHPSLPTVIVLAGGYGFCFAMAVLLVVSTMMRRRRRSREPDGRPSAFEWTFAVGMVCFAGAVVTAAVVDLASGGGNIGFLVGSVFALLIVLRLTVDLVRRSRANRRR